MTGNVFESDFNNSVKDSEAEGIKRFIFFYNTNAGQYKFVLDKLQER